jgi:hypothetical protein
MTDLRESLTRRLSSLVRGYDFAETTLREEIRNQRTLGNIAGLDSHLHRIEAVGNVLDFEQLQVTPGGKAKRLLFAVINGLGRAAKLVCRAGADLDENQDVAVTADDVDLTTRDFVITRQYPVTVTAQESTRDALTIIPDLQPRRQRRRTNALVSA